MTVQERNLSIVERALRRRTLARISGLDRVRDVAMEVFTLAPASTDARQATS